MPEESKKIHFKIDKTSHEIDASQNPVKGEYLRNLPPVVPDDYDLWLRGRDGADDIIIKPTDDVTVKDGDHFFTAKRVSTEGAVI